MFFQVGMANVESQSNEQKNILEILDFGNLPKQEVKR